MREVEIALGLIQQGDEFLLQHRNGESQVGAVGLIGCFGGKVEKTKDKNLPKNAVSREIGEETTFESNPEDWELVGEVNVIADHKQEPFKVHATAFRFVIGNNVAVEAKEGKLVRMTLDQVRQRYDELTPATKALFKEFYKE